MSATRPASELSIGIIARSASPPSTAAKTSSNDAQGDRLPVGVVLLAHQVGVGARLALVGDASAPGESGEVTGRHPTASGARSVSTTGGPITRLGPWILASARPRARPRRARPVRRRAAPYAAAAPRRQADALPEDVHGLRQEVAALKPRGRRRAAPPRGRAVRRVRRHGRAPVLVAGPARRRRPRGRAHLDPRPQRGPHLRQEHHRLDLRAAALARGGRSHHPRPLPWVPATDLGRTDGGRSSGLPSEPAPLSGDAHQQPAVDASIRSSRPGPMESPSSWRGCRWRPG